MLAAFRNGCQELGEIWSLALHPETMAKVLQLSDSLSQNSKEFHLEDGLWVRLIYDFACAHKTQPLERGHLLRSLTPLYLGRVASLVLETQNLLSHEFEEKIEQLGVRFEQLKPYLTSRWAGQANPASVKQQVSDVR
jgi:hypothetical protein